MLFSGWILVLGVAVLALTALHVFSKKQHSGGDNVPTGIRVTRIIAVVYAVMSVIGLVVGVVSSLWNETVMVNLPVASFWPSLPSTVDVTGTTADVVRGGFEHALVSVAGLDTATRVWLASSAVLQGTTNTVIALVVVALCTSILRGNPFRRALTPGINLTGTTIIFGGLGWQVCDAVAGSLASFQVLGASGWTMNAAQVDWNDAREIIGLPQTGQEAWTVDFWPIWVGLALFAVAAAFRYGERRYADSAEGVRPAAGPLP